MRTAKWHWIDLLSFGLSAAAVALSLSIVTGKSNLASAEPPAPDFGAIVDVRGRSTTLSRHVMGSSTARTVLIEFVDFECSYCGEYVRKTYPQIRDAYIATGRVRYTFRHYPLENHSFALNAARAAECATMSGRFWDMRTWLFDHQAELGLGDLQRHAHALTLDETVTSCMAASTVDAEIMVDISEAQRLGVLVTPVVLIGTVGAAGKHIDITKRVTGAQAYAVYQRAIEDVLN